MTQESSRPRLVGRSQIKPASTSDIVQAVRHSQLLRLVVLCIILASLSILLVSASILLQILFWRG